MRLWLAWLSCSVLVWAQDDVENEESRKVLGSSVVTSVSVIMDHGNGTKTYLTDSSGQPLDGDVVASPVDLLNPDRYEFYTFDETGDLVKRLMTLDEIKGLLASGDGETLDSPNNSPTFYHDSLSSDSHLDDSDLEPNMAQGVHNVVTSVQNVLKGELESTKKKAPPSKLPLTIPDSISTWSMLFPAIISDAEALDDGNDSGNSVDRQPAPSNEEKTEVRPPHEEITTKTEETASTEKPTAVPPIIHFLEIHSVPASAKNPTKAPINLTASTTPVSTTSTTETPTTTNKPTSGSPIQDMSASISSLLSQVTDKQAADHAGSTADNALVTDIPLPTTEKISQTSTESDKATAALKPESSIVQLVTKKPSGSTTVPTKVSKPNQTSTSSQSQQKTANKNNDTKKTTDTVVSYVSTAKPVPSSSNTAPNKSKPASGSLNKQKIQATTPSSNKKTNNKNQSATSAVYKKPTRPTTTVNKIQNGIDTLEAHGSEEIVKIVPNKNKPSQAALVSTKTKNTTQTKTNGSTTVPSGKPMSKPVKKVPMQKPHVTEESPDCNTTRKTPPPGVHKNNEKLEVAASSNINERVKPSKTKPPIMQEIKTVQRPTTSQTIKPTVNKIRPSEDIKITTYKPSTSHPFTTKQSVNKISTTTQRPQSENKIESPSKIHEVNSSLLDIKEHVVDYKNNKTPTQSTTKTPVQAANYESAASDTKETNVSVSNNTKESSENKNTTDQIDHTTEVECTHSKNPVPSSIQDKLEASNDNEDEKATADSITPTTEAATDATTDMVTDTPTESIDESVTTTERSAEVATELPETTTLNMPDMDVVKEGISAVTNILLDENPVIEPQLPLPTLPLSESVSSVPHSPPVEGELKHAASFVDFEMFTTNVPAENNTAPSATEKDFPNVYFTTTEVPSTETVSPTTESISNNSSEESVEEVTEVETTPGMEVTTTEETEQKQTSESKIVVATVNNQTLPTKGSKLSPENIDETVGNVLCNHTSEEMNKTLNVSHSNNNLTDHLEPSQSVISTVNKTRDETTSPESVTTPKSSSKDTVNFKTAGKPDPVKFTQVKYPNVNAYRPLSDTANPPTAAVELHPAPHESMGLEATTAFLADDVRRFSDLCNELAFRMWTSITGKGSISSRSLVLSPFATTSILAMVFLGARGPTSGQMNDVLRLDDMVTFNPHQVLQNVTESVLNSRNYGVATAAFVRELYSDKLKGKILDFYKERAQQYYDGHVEEISFSTVGDTLRRRTNLLVKRQTLGKVPEYLRGSNLSLRPPLAAFSANIFQSDCELASTEGRDGEMYFVVRPSTRQRRLVPVPAAVWRTGFLAGYEPALDATAVALGTDSVVSTILVLPGQQGQVAPGDGLARLEQRLVETSYRRGGWTRMLRSLLPRPGLELQVPRFSHRSVLNVTSTLQRMGLKDLFNENKADLRGINGLSNDLHLSDMVQVNTFSTCGEDTIGARHHIETYPVNPQRMGRDDPELYPRPEDFEDPELLKVPLNLRPRQARLPDSPRLRFDRPFLYMVRHNPTGMILHMGRFNPRLLP